jgi:hypothetical protein
MLIDLIYIPNISAKRIRYGFSTSLLNFSSFRIDFNFKSSLDIAVYIQCKPKDVQSLQSSYFLFFYHFGFEATTLTFSRIIDFDDATNLLLKQVYSCAIVDTCLIWTDR